MKRHIASAGLGFALFFSAGAAPLSVLQLVGIVTDPGAWLIPLSAGWLGATIFVFVSLYDD